MNYSRLIKTVDTTKFYTKVLDIKLLKAQYNPYRFHIWKSLHTGPKNEVLNMRFSAHYKFLKGDTTPYYQLQKKYGRKITWILNKTDKFLNLYDSIKLNGILKDIVILETPLAKNKYNKGFEIFEGHHRVACALTLNIQQIRCKIIERQ